VITSHHESSPITGVQSDWQCSGSFVACQVSDQVDATLIHVARRDARLPLL